MIFAPVDISVEIMVQRLILKKSTKTHAVNFFKNLKLLWTELK